MASFIKTDSFKYKMDFSVRELKVDIIQKYVFLNTIVELGDHISMPCAVDGSISYLYVSYLT